MTSLKGKVAVGVLTVLTALGFGMWIIQQLNGLGVTGMSNANSWGLYIILFMFFVGLSAGGLIVASSAHVFQIESFKRIALPAVITSTASICVAGVFVLADLGGIARVWQIFAGPNFVSPLLWDMCVIILYLVINVLDLVWMARGDEHRVAMLSRVALPVAILVHSVTAWIFGLQIAKAWYTAILAPIFVASAMDSGLALLLLILVALSTMRLMELSNELLGSLARLLAVFVAVDFFFIFCEVLTSAYPGGEHMVALSEMLTGRTAPFFWFEVIAGQLIPFMILCSKRLRESRSAVVISSILVIMGVLCKRIWLLLTAFIHPNVSGAPGIPSGTASASMLASPDTFSMLGSFAPTLIELCVSTGVVCAGCLLFLGLYRLFNDSRPQKVAAN
ncbi:polysulfide reductase NrfD [Berryella wangjianweii]|uniref:Polysulfide reductase NrfD n=1 Tax=Berryella wangjianweii TaxID=2734634 RepID=A0A6M8J7H4_9ACTN|nr:NrfD/PsrC family molybdoenzyme membrane anchor subunit [Berryella wangjianweii]QKF07836.1 polysulfide reductase NrfD [Berryella wangjianweii]